MIERKPQMHDVAASPETPPPAVKKDMQLAVVSNKPLKEALNADTDANQLPPHNGNGAANWAMVLVKFTERLLCCCCGRRDSRGRGGRGGP